VGLRAVIVAAGIALLSTLPVLKGQFIWEDHDIIVKNLLPRSVGSLGMLLSPGYWAYHYTGSGPYYLPMQIASHALDCALFGLSSPSHHAVSLLLHVLNAGLVYALGRALGLSRRGAWLGAALFGIHPGNVEAVAWLKNRSLVLGMTFLLISWLAFEGGGDAKWRVPTALGAYLLAVLCKETTVMLAGVALLLNVARLGRTDRGRWVIAVGYVATGAAFLIARGVWLPSGPATGLGTSPAHHALSAMRACGFYVKAALFPIHMKAMHSWQRTAPVWSRANLAGMIWCMGLVMLGFMSGRRRGLLWLAVFVLFVVPSLGAMYIPGRAVTEQRLYFPLVAFVMLFVGSVHRARRRVALAALLFLFASFAAGRSNRAFDWADGLSLWSASARQSPSCLVHCNLGVSHALQGRHRQAEVDFQRAIGCLPEDSLGYRSLGMLYRNQGRLDDALHQYQKAIQCGPNEAVNHSELGKTLANLGRYRESIPHFRSAIRLSPRFRNARLNLARALAEEGEYDKAREEWQRSLCGSGYADAPVYCALGDMERARGDLQKALSHYERSVSVWPSYIPALCHLGAARLELGMPKRALRAYLNARDAAPLHPHVWLGLYLCWKEMGDLASANSALARVRDLAPELHRTTLESF